MNQGRARYVWDYDITQEQFDALLAGKWEKGPLNRDWAAVRLILRILDQETEPSLKDYQNGVTALRCQ